MSNRDSRSHRTEQDPDPGPSLRASLDGDARPVSLAHGTGVASTEHSASAPAAATLSNEDALIGTVLGSYQVVELLGKGGMGCVFRAKHMKLDRDVALKLLRTEHARHRGVVTRFFQEARAVNRVRHRNIVDVTDFVELPDGTTFIIMELLRGWRLGSWVRSGVDVARILEIFVQICDGLGAAHDVGVIHRDLKPDNIIIVPAPDGTEVAKILDFGVAKLLHRDGDFRVETAAGTVVGTPAYMSPEQARGLPVDARSDIYSLGAIMYSLFCGQPVFRANGFTDYARKHVNETPTPPSATLGGPQIDPQLELVILQCLQKAPARRFATVANLRDALLAILGQLVTRPPQSGARELKLESLLTATPTGASIPERGPAPRLPPVARRRRSWPRWLLTGSIAAAIGAGGAVWYAHDQAPQPTVMRAVATPPRITPAAAPLPAVVPPAAEFAPSTEPADVIFEEPLKPAKPSRKRNNGRRRLSETRTPSTPVDPDRGIDPTETLDPFPKKKK